jgi:uncharacterized protein
MSPFRWIRPLKKSMTERPIEPPIGLGNRSNGEYYHEQTPHERRIRQVILETASENARRIGWDRRDFLASAMGMLTSLWVVQQLGGCGAAATGQTGGYPVPPDAMTDADLACKLLDPGKEFIFDVQTHHVSPQGGWRKTNPGYEGFLKFLPQHSCGETDIPECYSARHFVEEIFVDSDTTVALLSALPAQECGQGVTGPCDFLLRNEDMVATRELVNGTLARSQRLLHHAMVMPNLNLAQQLATMERAHHEYKATGWKCYTNWGPERNGFWLDDPKIGIPFIEKGRQLGAKIFCVHKGLPVPGGDSIHTDSKDIGVVAKAFPDVTFIVYHAGFGYGVTSGPFVEGPYDPTGSPSTANLSINNLIKALKDNSLAPGSNVYVDLGSVWTNVMASPAEAQHAIGKLLKHVGENNVLWGTDCIWTGSPQPLIEAFRLFQISQEFQEKYGYPALTDAIKRKVLGLNAAKVFGVDPAAVRCAIDKSQLAHMREVLDGELGPRRFSASLPAGPRTRGEFFRFVRAQGNLPG